MSGRAVAIDPEVDRGTVLGVRLTGGELVGRGEVGVHEQAHEPALPQSEHVGEVHGDLACRTRADLLQAANPLRDEHSPVRAYPVREEADVPRVLQAADGGVHP
jgi:hypothetical protein